MFVSSRTKAGLESFALACLMITVAAQCHAAAVGMIDERSGRSPSGHDVRLSIELVPQSVLPGEPVAVYTTLSNRGSSPVLTTLQYSDPGLYCRDEAGKEVRLPPYQRGDAFLESELKPGESVRRKTWVLWSWLKTDRRNRQFGGKESPVDGQIRVQEPAVTPPRRADRAVPRYGLPAPGEYRIYARSGYAADGRRVALVSEPAVLRIRAPLEREEAAKDLLTLALPDRVQEGRLVRAYPTLDTTHFFLTEAGPPLLPKRPILEERGSSGLAASIAGVESVYATDTPYAWYAALVLARWHARAIDTGRYQKPARWRQAAEVLASIEHRPIPPALREEVLVLQAEVHYAMGKREAADTYLKQLAAMDPAEPVASEVERIRRTWRTMEGMLAALEQGDWLRRSSEAAFLHQRRPDVAEELSRRAFASEDELARLLGACELNQYYKDAQAIAYLWQRFEDPPEDPYAFGWLLSALAREQRPEFQPRLKQELDNADPVVRMWTAETLWLYYRDRSGVPVLIEILASGREPANYPSGGVLGALRRTTGQNFGRDAAAWRAWWREQSSRDQP